MNKRIISLIFRHHRSKITPESLEEPRRWAKRRGSLSQIAGEQFVL